MVHAQSREGQAFVTELLSGKFEFANIENEHGGRMACAPLWCELFEYAQQHTSEVKWICVLGECHLLRRGGAKRDNALALKFFKRSAAQQFAHARYRLGMCFFLGWGVPKDAVLGAIQYQLAAEQGHACAQKELGWCYAHGVGVETDRSYARLWFNKAAEQGVYDTSGTVEQFNLHAAAASVASTVAPDRV